MNARWSRFKWYWEEGVMLSLFISHFTVCSSCTNYLQFKNPQLKLKDADKSVNGWCQLIDQSGSVLQETFSFQTCDLWNSCDHYSFWLDLGFVYQSVLVFFLWRIAAGGVWVTAKLSFTYCCLWFCYSFIQRSDVCVWFHLKSRVFLLVLGVVNTTVKVNAVLLRLVKCQTCAQLYELLLLQDGWSDNWG